jgi:hypothetical protein
MMMPETVQFSGLEVDPVALTRRRVVHAPFPPTWTRLTVASPSFDIRKIETWLLENVGGRFGLTGNYPVAIYFEDDVDAVMFRLKDGEKILAE